MIKARKTATIRIGVNDKLHRQPGSSLWCIRIKSDYCTWDRLNENLNLLRLISDCQNVAVSGEAKVRKFLFINGNTVNFI